MNSYLLSLANVGFKPISLNLVNHHFNNSAYKVSMLIIFPQMFSYMFV